MYLNCHTAYSFKYGTLPVKTLFEEAKKYGIQKLVLTEINNTASYIEMLRLCKENAPVDNNLTKYGHPAYALEIAVGVEFRNESDLVYIIIAENNEGFFQINKFLSHHLAAGKPFPARAPELGDTVVIYPFKKTEPEFLRAHEFIGIRKQELIQYSVHPDRSEYSDRFVFLHPVTLFNETERRKACELQGKKYFSLDYNAHRLLRAIDQNTLLSKLAKEEQAHENEFMVNESELLEHLESYPELVTNTRQLLKRFGIDFNLGSDKNKKHIHGSAEEDLKYLERETWKGFEIRYGKERRNEETLTKRIEKELAVIKSKAFAAYYLIAYDLIQYAQKKSYPFVGRGSGANSTVAYCLGITNVDPIDLNLYFERFLNEERTSPPDFDIDFSWDNRDEIYDYIFQKYGTDHVCLLGTHVTFQWNSILRELGKVFGLPKDEIDLLVQSPSINRERDHITKMIYDYAAYIKGKELTTNISIHAGGVLITDKPIYTYTATTVPPKGYPVSHCDMHNAEDMGISKFDILSQRGLGHLKETVKHVKRNQGIDVDIHRFDDFKKDEKIKQLLRNSKAMGCFYVESPAMRMLLGKLQCEDYLTLVAASSIIRPGVASSGMMRAYIERYHAKKNGGSYESIHPRMDELMAETFGVMVYQEDVIKVAHEFAGLTLTEADVLRRGMSGKYRSREEFQRVRDRFFQCCQEKGYEQAVADRVWFEIESFSGYSFAKGHSASYAVESYQSLYLKAHYPLEFMVGVINNFGGFYRTEFYFHEARISGASIEAPCVNRSEHLTTIYGKQIFVGFVHLKSVESKVAKQISTERTEHGDYKSLDNFIRRNNIGLEQIRILIRIGAFRFTGKSKQKLLWEAMLYFSQAKTKRPGTELFETEPKEYPLPALQRNDIEDAFDEIELLGFPICDPFTLLQTNDRGNVKANDLIRSVGKSVDIVGYLVTVKETSTKTKQRMNFGTFYDCDGNVFDTVHFPDIAKRFPLRGRGFYAIKGKVVEDFGVAMIEVSWMDKLPMINKRAEEFMRENIYESRDQHPY